MWRTALLADLVRPAEKMQELSFLSPQEAKHFLWANLLGVQS